MKVHRAGRGISRPAFFYNFCLALSSRGTGPPWKMRLPGRFPVRRRPLRKALPSSGCLALLR